MINIGVVFLIYRPLSYPLRSLAYTYTHITAEFFNFKLLN